MAEIQLREVRKSFRSTRVVLGGVSLDVEPGQVFALLGPNGAGKTTLVRILCTLVLPDAGEVRIRGIDALRHPQRARRLLGVALDSDRSFFLRLSALENLRFFAALCELAPRDAWRRANELLESLGLAGAARKRVMEFSSGMKQKLALARALLADPPVLVLDEPTRGLDPLAAAEFRGALHHLVRSQRKTVLLVTHSLEECAELADAAGILCHGRLEGLGGDWRSTLAAEYRRVVSQQQQEAPSCAHS